MAKVKVWNDNVHPHKEKFKDEWLEIAPGESIEMDFEDALEFKGQFTPMIIRADGTHDPKGYKKIRVERPATPIFKDDSLICHADGQRAATKDDLRAMLSQYGHLQVKDPELEQGPNTAELLRRLAALEAQVAEKKKPGPKPKLFKKEA